MLSLTLKDNFNQKLENLPSSLQSLTLGYHFNQKLENLPNSLQSLTLGANFCQKLDNLPDNLQRLTLGHIFNEKLENLPNSLRSLTLGWNFNQKLNVCLALPKLRILKICENYRGNVPVIFGVTITINDYYGCGKKEIKNQAKQNYDFIEWKNIFYKSIRDLL